MPYKDKDEQAAAQRRHYQANKEAYKRRFFEKKQRVRELLREFKNKPCQDCGVRYPYYVMELDHRDPSTKKYNPADLPSHASERIFWEEVTKCDVVCANCHRERTHGHRLC